MLTRIACEEVVSTASEYDAATWKEAAAKIHAGEVGFSVGKLMSLDENKLSEIKRQKARAAEKKAERARDAGSGCQGDLHWSDQDW